MTMPQNSIRQEEERLFEQWRRVRPDLVTDGVVDEERYRESARRIVLVLKEVNDPDGGRWDLRETLRNGRRQQTWDNVTRWLMGIRALPASTDWKRIKRITKADRVRELASIVAMNVKKSPGGAVAVEGRVLEAAHRDAELLERQLALYDPDLIIGCGKDATRALRREIQTIKSAEWQTTTRGARFLRLATGSIYLDFCHPIARVAPELVCYSLFDAVREIDAS